MSVNTGGADQVEIERLTAKVEELEAAPTKANVMADTIKAMGQDITRLKATITELTVALRGIAGGSVYRKSHEHVSKELGAVRRFAQAALKEKEL